MAAIAEPKIRITNVYYRNVRTDVYEVVIASIRDEKFHSTYTWWQTKDEDAAQEEVEFLRCVILAGRPDKSRDREP